jgi:hypothetical protein
MGVLGLADLLLADISLADIERMTADHVAIVGSRAAAARDPRQVDHRDQEPACTTSDLHKKNRP